MSDYKKRIIGIDVGTVRTGLAISDLTGFLASPLDTVHVGGMKKLVNAVYSIVLENDVETVVIGHPKHMDGTVGDSALRCEEFAKRLYNRAYGDGRRLETVLWDERMTTVTAESYLRDSLVKAKDRKEIIDSAAATVILQSYLDSKR